MCIRDSLKANALRAIEGLGADESKDTISVKAQVVSINRRRITVTYEGTFNADGAAHPVNLFYSNTVDMESAGNLGLSDYADPYTVAGYIASGDYKFAEGTKAVSYTHLLLHLPDLSGNHGRGGHYPPREGPLQPGLAGEFKPAGQLPDRHHGVHKRTISFAPASVPVSYTHLDVYKRQAVE